MFLSSADFFQNKVFETIILESNSLEKLSADES